MIWRILLKSDGCSVVATPKTPNFLLNYWYHYNYCVILSAVVQT